MPVGFLSPLLTECCRSNSVYRAYSALIALIRLSLSSITLHHCVFLAYASNGCIFNLQKLADSCDEKEYLLSLVDLGQAACFARTRLYKNSDLERGGLRFSDSLRDVLLGIIPLQQYVHSPSISTVILRFSQQ